MMWRAAVFWLFLGSLYRPTDSTCVLKSEFGWSLNCGFKQSGLFRVRNLGGVKGYFGLGFSVGDSLGFKEALSQVEGRRRSVVGVPTQQIAQKEATQVATAAQGRANNHAIAVRNPVGSLMRPVTQLPPFRPIPQDSQYPTQVRRSETVSNPQYVAVGPIRNASHLVAHQAAMQAMNPVNPQVIFMKPQQAMASMAVPAYQGLPSPISRMASANFKPLPTSQAQPVQAPLAFRNALQNSMAHFIKATQVSPVYKQPTLSSNTLSLRTLPSGSHIQKISQGAAPTLENIAISPEDVPLASAILGHTIKAMAKASNLSVEAISAALTSGKVAAASLPMVVQAPTAATTTTTPSTTTTATTTTPSPVVPPRKYALASLSKVMNAPKEYYPVGYDKNFDDNFASRVELPDTSFTCGQQKHFPGLYADEDLGCMVFHVCAFTDEGLIMKSFLCPESTLFDQTILKCNWWFYVDCKASTKLYDSNIPISKSYQLMKALAFFSAYKS